jgi:hypothetical protein
MIASRPTCQRTGFGGPRETPCLAGVRESALVGVMGVVLWVGGMLIPVFIVLVKCLRFKFVRLGSSGVKIRECSLSMAGIVRVCNKDMVLTTHLVSVLLRTRASGLTAEACVEVHSSTLLAVQDTAHSLIHASSTATLPTTPHHPLV